MLLTLTPGENLTGRIYFPTTPVFMLTKDSRFGNYFAFNNCTRVVDINSQRCRCGQGNWTNIQWSSVYLPQDYVTKLHKINYLHSVAVCAVPLQNLRIDTIWAQEIRSHWRFAWNRRTSLRWNFVGASACLTRSFVLVFCMLCIMSNVIIFLQTPALLFL